MKKFISLAFGLAALPFLVQCASQRDVADLRYQMRIVNKKIDDMRSSTVDPLQKRQAAATGQMEQLEKEILELKNQLEDTAHLNQQLKDQNKEEAAKREDAVRRMEELQREKEAQLADLNSKLNAQQESVKAIQEARLKDAERKAKEAALNAELARKKTQAIKSGAPGAAEDKTSARIQSEKKKTKIEQTADPAPQASQSPQPAQETAAPAAASQASEKADSNFKKAQMLFDKNSYSEALPLFEQVAADSSSSEGVEARYMMGECLFNQKEYDKAIMQYQKIISQNSGHAKAPAAMLKQGMAFEKLADKETAKVIYKKLLKKHANSPEAAKAQESLGKL